MARITVRQADGPPCVRVAGRLSARDLRRLERACGRALEQAHVDLELRLTAVTTMDGAARAFVERLVYRGARVID